jgi:hypothetical protein
MREATNETAGVWGGKSLHAGGRYPYRRESDLLYVRGLQSLRSVDDLELHGIPLGQ